jgi:hypothetical protein
MAGEMFSVLAGLSTLVYPIKEVLQQQPMRLPG